MANALESGMDALKKATELPFPEFTAKLVTSTFDAVIAGTVHQMEAYADLVANLAKTLERFQAENVTDAEINKFLSDNYPDGSGGTTVRSDYTFTDTPASGDKPAEPGADKLKKVYENIVNVRLADVFKPTGTIDKPAALAAGATKFTKEQVVLINQGVGRKLATGMMEHLRAMAREGMARIVIDNGEILSKLTFNVSSTDIEATSKSNYHRDQANAYIRGKAGFGWWGVKAGASYSSLNVKVTNERTFSKVTMDAQMIGQVTIHFHTETFPQITTAPTPP